jgi:hypothetical protein
MNEWFAVSSITQLLPIPAECPQVTGTLYCTLLYNVYTHQLAENLCSVTKFTRNSFVMSGSEYTIHQWKACRQQSFFRILWWECMGNVETMQCQFSNHYHLRTMIFSSVCELLKDTNWCNQQSFSSYILQTKSSSTHIIKQINTFYISKTIPHTVKSPI